ncbi:hypothetical protein Tco_0952083, partial [Tanacetum coccineum]
MGKEDRNCIPKHIVSLVEDFDSWNDYPWGEYMWNFFYKRTVNVVAIHRADHLKKKKQNSDYYPTYNLYGFAWAFKIWILESYPNSRKWWSKKDNVLPRALAWSNVTKFEKNDYNSLFGPDSNPNLELYATPVEKQTEWFIVSIQFIKGLVDEDLYVTQDDGVGVVSGNCVNLQHNSVSVVSVFINGNHNAVNQGLSGSANHPMSTCSGANILDGEVTGALIRIYKAYGNNDNPNVNHNVANKGLYCSANDPIVRINLPDMDNGEVVVAGMGIHMADGQNDIPNTNDNVVNQGIIGSANDPM